MAVNIILQAILRANVSQFINGLNQAKSALQGMQGLAGLLSKAFDVYFLQQFLNLAMQLKDVLAGVIMDLLETAGKWQQMTIGMAAVVLASNKITDSTGKQLSYAEQFNRAIIVSKDLMQKLRIDAALNIGTTDDLASAYIGLANAVSTTTKKGEDGIQKTRSLANALIATSYILGPAVLKGGKDQAIRETNELLEGRLTKINTLARTLGLTTASGKDAYKEAFAAGKVYDFLMGKLSAYSAAQKQLAYGYEGLMSTLKDLLDLVKQTTAEFGFERVNNALKELVDQIVIRLPDGTAKISDAFKNFFNLLAPIFDELMIPLIDLTKTFIQIIVENKEVIVSFLRLTIQLLSLLLESFNSILQLIRPGLSLILSLLSMIMDSISLIVGGINGLLRSVSEFYNQIMERIKPALEALNNFLTEKFQPTVQWFLSKMGLSTNLQEEDNKKKKDAATLAKTHVEALGGLNEALDSQNQKLKDNTQHWKNWISTLKAAYSSRFPAAAQSFMTMFGHGGTLSPTSASAGSIPVNINLNGPHGNMSIPAQMTPQALAQAHQTGRQFSGSLNKMTKSTTLNPVLRNGAVYQN